MVVREFLARIETEVVQHLREHGRSGTAHPDYYDGGEGFHFNREITLNGAQTQSSRGGALCVRGAPYTERLPCDDPAKAGETSAREEASQYLAHLGRGQLFERPLFDLPYALPREIEPPAYLVEGVRTVLIYAEPEPDYLFFPGRQDVERVPDLVG